MVKDNDILEIGTLVQVRDDALQPSAEYYTMNQETVSNHGYLYIIHAEPSEEVPRLYECKSLATGVIEGWFASELNVVEPNDG